MTHPIAQIQVQTIRGYITEDGRVVIVRSDGTIEIRLPRSIAPIPQHTGKP